MYFGCLGALHRWYIWWSLWWQFLTLTFVYNISGIYFIVTTENRKPSMEGNPWPRFFILFCLYQTRLIFYHKKIMIFLHLPAWKTPPEFCTTWWFWYWWETIFELANTHWKNYLIRSANIEYWVIDLNAKSFLYMYKECQSDKRIEWTSVSCSILFYQVLLFCSPIPFLLRLSSLTCALR